MRGNRQVSIDMSAPQQGRLQRSQQLKEQIASLEAEKKVLTSRLEELSAREKVLAGKVRELQFVNARQAEQIEALAEAPAERDLYKARAQKLQLDVTHLTRRLAELERTVTLLRSRADEPKPAAPVKDAEGQ